MKGETAQEELMKRLKYNHITGDFTWTNKLNGRVAGHKHSSGYVRIGDPSEGRVVLAHRLAFLYMTGEIPEQVDHINHVKDDNRWCNLRGVSASENARNQFLCKNNKSGTIGVCFNKKYKKWHVYISVNKKQIYLGYYDNKETAITIRKGAELWYGYHKNHGGTS